MKFLKKHRKLAIIVAIAVVVILVVAVVIPALSGSKTDYITGTLTKKTMQNAVSATGNIVSQHTRDVVSTSNLKVLSLNKKVGDQIVEGDVLAVLDTSSLDNDLKSAQLQKDQAQNALHESTKLRDSNVQNAKTALESAREDYNNAVDDLDNSLQVKIAELGVQAAEVRLRANSNSEELQIARDQAQLQYEIALQSVGRTAQKAKIALDSAQNAYNTAVGKSTEAERISLENANNALKKVTKLIDEATITSPATGILTYSAFEVGQVAQGIMFTLETADSLKITVDVSQYDVGTIKLGQSVSIKSDATGEDEFAGKVTSVPVSSKKSSGSASGQMTELSQSSTTPKFQVEVSLDKADKRLLPGMSARINIIQDERKNVFAVPYDAIVEDNEGKMIYVLDANDQPTIVVVETGLESDVEVEITANSLKSGMHYITNPEEMNMTAEERRMKRVRDAQ
jgi:multidrug efflux pump subunit AcrA (membrane-fusion protein)